MGSYNGWLRAGAGDPYDGLLRPDGADGVAAVADPAASAGGAPLGLRVEPFDFPAALLAKAEKLRERKPRAGYDEFLHSLGLTDSPLARLLFLLLF